METVRRMMTVKMNVEVNLVIELEILDYVNVKGKIAWIVIVIVGVERMLL
jgi:hypothetical protein